MTTPEEVGRIQAEMNLRDIARRFGERGYESSDVEVDSQSLERANFALSQIPIVSIPYPLMMTVREELGEEYIPTVQKIFVSVAIWELRRPDDVFGRKSRFADPNPIDLLKEIQFNLPHADHPRSYLKVARRQERLSRRKGDNPAAVNAQHREWVEIATKWSRLTRLLEPFGIGYRSYLTKSVNVWRKRR